MCILHAYTIKEYLMNWEDVGGAWVDLEMGKGRDQNHVANGSDVRNSPKNINLKKKLRCLTVSQYAWNTHWTMDVSISCNHLWHTSDWHEQLTSTGS